MKPIRLFIIGLSLVPAAHAHPTSNYPDLPPFASVVTAISSHPSVLAAKSGIDYEQANKTRLRTGAYETNVKVGAQDRRDDANLRNYNEWDVLLERPFRLPRKATLDEQLGQQGVEVAQYALGDAMYETGRALLRQWFAWLKARMQTVEWLHQKDIAARQLDAVRKRTRAGDAPRQELILAEAALAQVDYSLSQARMRETIAANELTQNFPGVPLPARPVLLEPQPVTQPLDYWRGRILERNYELAVARAEVKRRQLLLTRTQTDQTPDPTVGVRYASERSGSERIVGLVFSIPLPGAARYAASDGASAQAEIAAQREVSVLRKISAEIASTYTAATSAYESWSRARHAADGLKRSADLAWRAYELGESNLAEVLAARRLAIESNLTATVAQLDAAESRYRLMLNAHLLWPLDTDADEQHDTGQTATPP